LEQEELNQLAAIQQAEEDSTADEVRLAAVLELVKERKDTIGITTRCIKPPAPPPFYKGAFCTDEVPLLPSAVE